MTQPPKRSPPREADLLLHTMSDEAREIVACLERDRGRRLTDQEIHLALAQAEAIGEL